MLIFHWIIEVYDVCEQSKKAARKRYSQEMIKYNKKEGRRKQIEDKNMKFYILIINIVITFMLQNCEKIKTVLRTSSTK